MLNFLHTRAISRKGLHINKPACIFQKLFYYNTLNHYLSKYDY